MSWAQAQQLSRIPTYAIGRRVVDRFAHQDIAGLEQLLEEVEQEQMAQTYRRLNAIVIKDAIHSLDKNYPLAEEDSEFLTTYSTLLSLGPGLNSIFFAILCPS